MKKLLLFIVLTVTTGGLFAQTNFRFADSTAQWTVLASTSWGQPSTPVYRVVGDTIIAGKQYQNINSLNPFPLAIDPIRKDSTSKVFAKSPFDSVEIMIYDFGAVKGDSFAYNTYHIPYLACRIDSVDSIMLDRMRKRMFVTYMSDSFSTSIDPPLAPYRDYDVWIEGIGALYTPFYLPGFQIVANIGGPAFSLLCFSEKNTTVYIKASYTSCDITDVNEIVSETSIKLSPNPYSGNNSITIQTENNLPPQTTFQLFDITGRMVLQKQLTGDKTNLPLNEISKGLYLYKVTSGEKKIGSGKLVVQ